MRQRSPNSCLDAERKSSVIPPPDLSQPVPVRLRQRSLSRGEFHFFFSCFLWIHVMVPVRAFHRVVRLHRILVFVLS